MIRATAGRIQPPNEVEIAFKAAFGTVFLEFGGWVLDVLVIPPTGFRQLEEHSGLSGAILQLCLSAAVLAVLSAAWLLCAVWMRRGRNGARWVMIVVGAGYLLFALNDMSMNGLATLDWSILSSYAPDIFTAAISVVLLLPASRAYFSAAGKAG
ncbi:hypothetical protein Stsp01_17970 [Streptomyces sp. NBRC 13847]|uniref:hypothetical protein n=1 Tax=Streptomyces TaxID=1883 RepID=UPI0024A35981|nr:hypothetical protein [Streptomyces sp. NBRC 13847]GLW15054.1 hypothetical protein Stsp01_17970 [Streptomyces sp. NBRC 13847]